MVATKSSPEQACQVPDYTERKSESGTSRKEWLILLVLFVIAFLLYHWTIAPWIERYTFDNPLVQSVKRLQYR
ncbi:hypothetical protein SAMN05216167_112103 [Spirosoma endophyticum]|uniref:Uncharacterized protein n=1 Tax=Spirosoma endophyticum TaxID=662367 RepID=A0A1I1ZEY2_9BACT|nr:hypothetical protein SAMN05216167_112103 [Spirosoma endophyticum]